MAKSRRPRLTDAEQALAITLREERKWSAARIARRLKCSEGSVNWLFLNRGIEVAGDTPPRPAPVPVEPVIQRRGNHQVRRYTQAEDEVLIGLRIKGLNCSDIGRSLDPPRKPNSVLGRLLTLARREARAEAHDLSP